MIRNKKHLKFIASLPCLTTGLEGSTQAAHIRSGLYAMGMKPDDSLTVPLSWQEHTRQHNTTERKFWADYGGVEKVKDLAKRLFDISGDEILARSLIEGFRNET